MDERRRYLRQLLELGEKDLVLEVGQTARRPDGQERSGSRDVQMVRRPDGQERPGSADRLGVRRSGSVVGGPPMYPPGIAVEGPPPSTDLFHSDPVATLSSLAELATVVEACRKCALGHSRTHSVPGEGNPNAQMVLVGEAPGATEDETGRPFVGRAGRLLGDILKAIGLAREAVFICNVLKCRPPGNRTPEPLEIAACSPYLHRQLELIRPKVIVALGKPAATTLLATNVSLGELRGKVHRYRGIPVVVTYHPAALLRNPHWKAPTWDDVRIARRILDGEAC